MIKKIFFLIWVSLISFAIIWLANNNGSIVITWLNHEVKTDILTICILTVLFFIFLTFFTYLILRILSVRIRFIRFLKKDLSSQKDQIVNEHKKSIELIIKFFNKIDFEDKNEAVKIKKEIKSLIKNPELEKLLSEKINQLNN